MMRPRRGLDPSSVWAQRLRQLEQRLRTKEERIVVLETENAVLHLKLAETFPYILETVMKFSISPVFCTLACGYPSSILEGLLLHIGRQISSRSPFALLFPVWKSVYLLLAVFEVLTLQPSLCKAKSARMDLIAKLRFHFGERY